MKRTSKMTKASVWGALTLFFAFASVSHVAAQCIPPPTGLVSWWPGDGNANDIINGNDGTLQNGATFASGMVGQAFLFSEVDDVVLVPHSPSLNFGTGDFSIEAWAKLNSTSFVDDRYIVLKNVPFVPPSPGYSLRWFGNKLQFAADSCGGTGCPAGGTVDKRIEATTLSRDTAWHHYAAVRRGTIMELYYDGQLVVSADFGSVENPDTSGDLGIGNGATVAATNGWPGQIDEVGIYNRALLASEIQAIFNAGSAGKCKDTETPQEPPVAVAGTSLDGDDLLQLDGTLSSDSGDDPLTFSWQIDGEATPRLGQIVSIADLAVGNYLVTLTVNDGIDSTTDTMLFGVPAGFGVVGPTPDVLQEITLAIQDLIVSFQTSSFDAPNDKARENRRKALLNMLDKVFDAIGIGDFQAAIDQLRDVLAKSDGLGPPDSAPDWIIGTDAQAVFQAAFNLVDDLLFLCGECQ